MKDADVIISNGWDTRDNYLNEYRIDSEVIPNAIQLRNYNDIHPVSGPNGGKIKIAFIGRFYEAKGAPNFANAIRIFNEQYPDLSDKINFIFVGWGEKQVEEFAAATGNCTLVGRIPNNQMNDLLRNIHCGVALTKSNDTGAGGSGVSNNLLELMAAGRIIIAYNNIVYRQFPRSDFLRFVEENNDEELAAIFADIVRSFEKYLPLARNAREYITQFSIENHVKSLKDVIDRITNLIH